MLAIANIGILKPQFRQRVKPSPWQQTPPTKADPAEKIDEVLADAVDNLEEEEEEDDGDDDDEGDGEV